MSETSSNWEKPIVGLAGGIGSGKTTVARMLESLGGHVIDFDRLAHAELGESDVLKTIVEWWGTSVCSEAGVADRAAIAELVFSDPGELQRLEDLLYPRLRQRCEVLLSAAVASPGVLAVVLDAPKLYESGLDSLCDSVIFVDALKADRVCRVEQKRGWSEQELIRRENRQTPLDRKRAIADYVVVNHAGLDELQKQVEDVFSSLLKSFK